VQSNQIASRLGQQLDRIGDFEVADSR